MLKILIAKAIKKHGLKAILLKVGDIAVRQQKPKKMMKFGLNLKRF